MTKRDKRTAAWFAALIADFWVASWLHTFAKGTWTEDPLEASAIFVGVACLAAFVISALKEAEF